jgi:IS605 OrfB family transposase
MRQINHVIGQQLVATAQTTGKAMALEDLTGIRQRPTVRTAHRAQPHAWAFYQRRQFVAYKAQDAGLAVGLVAPAYTAQTCHRCGNRGHRHALTFVCPRCGVVLAADVNAALNTLPQPGRL